MSTKSEPADAEPTPPPASAAADGLSQDASRGALRGAAAIIVAAGSGMRAGGGIPKQHRPINGRSALTRCLEVFARNAGVERVLTAIRPGDEERFFAARASASTRLSPSEAAKLMDPVPGGAERQETVRLALEHLAQAPSPPRLAAIHDAARPFLPQAVLDQALDLAWKTGAVCVATPLVDTLRRGDGEDPAFAGEITPRQGLWRAQTPQIFAFESILAAHRAEAARVATDDAEIARRAGMAVALCPGAPELMKITEPQDFDFAELLAAREDGAPQESPMSAAPLPDIRVGQGFDVHRFGPNADGSTDHVMLCGVSVPHETGLIGHSDADVGLHALTDAVLGAAALGDIGRHFPPSDEAWRGAASDQFLAFAMRLVREAGGRPTLLDVTLICERPKIGPHASKMRARIAEIAEVDLARVSVKATTSEGLGFTGRREGIAALASASFVF